jgi:hypothetical protein
LSRNITISFSSKNSGTGTEIEVDGEEGGKQEAEVDGEGVGKLEVEEEEGKDGGDSETKLSFGFDFFLKKSTIVVFRFIFLTQLSQSAT